MYINDQKASSSLIGSEILGAREREDNFAEKKRERERDLEAEKTTPSAAAPFFDVSHRSPSPSLSPAPPFRLGRRMRPVSELGNARVIRVLESVKWPSLLS